ncbi:6431_t:CDS:2, partial [Ambispora leptoticha]
MSSLPIRLKSPGVESNSGVPPSRTRTVEGRSKEVTRPTTSQWPRCAS